MAAKALLAAPQIIGAVTSVAQAAKGGEGGGGGGGLLGGLLGGGGGGGGGLFKGLMGAMGGGGGMLSLAQGGIGALSAFKEGGQAKAESRMREASLRVDLARAKTQGLQDSVAILQKNNRAQGAAMAAGVDKGIIAEMERVGSLNLSNARAEATTNSAALSGSIAGERANQNRLKGSGFFGSLGPLAEAAGGIYNARKDREDA